MEKGEPSWWSDAIEHFQNDDIMAECIKTYGTDGLRGRGDLFYTIVRSIIGQQISVIAAESIWNRFETIFTIRFDAFSHDVIALEMLNGIVPPRWLTLLHESSKNTEVLSPRPLPWVCEMNFKHSSD